MRSRPSIWPLILLILVTGDGLALAEESRDPAPSAGGFEHVFGGDAGLDNSVSRIARSAEGGLVLSGPGDRTFAPTRAEPEWLRKVDAAGQEVWRKTLVGFRIRALTGLAGGRVGAVGIADPGQEQGDAIWVGSFDAAGRMVWQRQLREQGAALQGHDIAETPDGGIVVVGFALSGRPPAERCSGLAVKMDGEGNELWRRSLGNSGGDILLAVATAPGGDIMVAGRSTDGPEKRVAASVARLDGAGRLLWSTTKGEIDEADLNEGYQHIIALPDGGSLVAGTADVLRRSMRGYLSRLDAQGVTVWSTRLVEATDRPAYLQALTRLDGGRLVAALSTDHFEDGETSAIHLMLLDERGSAISAQDYRGKGIAHPSSLVALSDGAVALAGDTRPSERLGEVDRQPDGGSQRSHAGWLRIISAEEMARWPRASATR